MSIKNTITDQEYEFRISKIRKYLKEHEIEALLVTLGKNFQYILGSTAKPSERLTLGIISSHDPHAWIVCPSFEVTNIEKTTPVASDHIKPWEETDNPYILTYDLLKELSLTDSTIALSPQTPFIQFKKLEKVLFKAEIIDGYECFRNTRMVKTSAELQCLKQANKVTAESIEATFLQLEKGMTEKDVAQILGKEMSDRSGEPIQFAAVQFGKNSADPHGQPTVKKLQTDEVVLIDAGTTNEGYNGDITNTTFFGKPTKEFLNIYDIVEEAQHRAIEQSMIGAIPEVVDETARTYITEKGFGEYFTHRTGHGIGLDVHEDPYIVSTNKEPLLENTAHSVEPGIYLQGKFGVRIEDIVLVTSKSGSIRSTSVLRRFWEK